MRRRALVVAACLVAGCAALYCGVEKRSTQLRVEPAQVQLVAPDVPRAELESARVTEPATAKPDEMIPDEAHVRTSVVVTLHGVVRWPDGTPAGGALVEVKSTPDKDVAIWGGAPSFTTNVACDAISGEFHVADVSGPLLVSASARDTRGMPPSASKSARAKAPLWSVGPVRVDEPSHPCELVLAPGVALSGAVRDDTGALVDRFSLTALPCTRGADGALVKPLFVQRVSASFRKAGGRYEWNDVGRGEWAIVAMANGYARSVVHVVKLDEEPLMLDFVVPRPAEISGTLVDADGKPVAEHWIGVVYADEELWIPADAQCATNSDAEGNFRIEHVKPGKLRVRTDSSRTDLAHPEDWFEIAPGEKRSGLRLVTSTH